jgi:Fur family transcriptional regulator, ferric uptake regulator
MPTASGREEHEVLAAHLVRNRLKRSSQREAILDAFLEAAEHVSAEDLLRRVKRSYPAVGRTTIYRTLKVFKDAGLASELQLGGEARFEPTWKREHHDHFLCRACGEITEFRSAEIERVQEQIAAKAGFVVEGHRHHIFGVCRRCSGRVKAAARPRPAAGR